MSAGYVPVSWSPFKRRYDAAAIGGVLLYLGSFVGVSKAAFPPPQNVSDEILIMRALGSCALVLLTIILCIGPMARLDTRFAPLLYNRRHLGVLTFLLALAHALIALGYYHGFGSLNPLVSLLSINSAFTSVSGFPFQLLGLGALLVLFLMAATSHDFWLRTLSARTWKTLHMLVYPAYAMLIGHVGFGSLQAEHHPLLLLLVAASAALVCGLHITAGIRQARLDHTIASDAEWIDVGSPGDVPEGRAVTICVGSGHRIAIFKHQGKLSAVESVCAHQGGPLGEGRIIDGCITCPWHGWQYQPHDGCAPPPFVEKVRTFQVRVSAQRVLVNPKALAPGTPTTPAPAHEGDARA